MRYSLAHHSIRGARKYNEDRVGVAERDNAVLMVAADGLGGYAGGEIASEAVVETAVESFNKVRQPVIRDPGAFLVLTVMHAHRVVNKRAREAGIEVSLPRTTCVICLVQDGYAYWGHVGDSRLYHFRRNQLLTRTLDDSTSERMRRDGLINEDDMRTPNWQGQLVRCVGGLKRPVVTLGPETPLERDDMLLLCTDGLWRAFSNSQLIRQLRQERLDSMLEELLHGAEKRMRRDCDNASAVVLRWEDERTGTAPVYGEGMPRIDQEQLWRDARLRAQEKRWLRTGEEQPQRDEIDLAIEELESFIDEIERQL